MCSVSTSWGPMTKTSVGSPLSELQQQGFPLRSGLLLQANLKKHPQAEHSKLTTAENHTPETAGSVEKQSLRLHRLSDSSVHKPLGSVHRTLRL